MKKFKYSLLVLLFIIVLTGCSKKESKDVTTTTTEEVKTFTISFENSKCNSKDKSIYTYSDGRVIYSKCGDVYYIENDNKVLLSDAIDNGSVSLDDITSNMELIEALYDGGTKVYKTYDDNTLSDTSFKLEVCNKIEGSKDISFLSSDSTDYKCD